jgi:hypothetical protein
MERRPLTISPFEIEGSQQVASWGTQRQLANVLQIAFVS